MTFKVRIRWLGVEQRIVLAVTYYRKHDQAWITQFFSPETVHLMGERLSNKPL